VDGREGKGETGRILANGFKGSRPLPAARLRFQIVDQISAIDGEKFAKVDALPALYTL
jgi:hypothetical protein